MTAHALPLPERKAKFVSILHDTGSVSKAASAAQIDRSQAYKYRTEDATFKAMWDDALESRADDMEQEAHRRGFKGVERPVIYKGELCYYVDDKGEKKVLTTLEYSDALATIMLKATRPKKFRDQLELTGNLDISSRIFAARKRVGGG